MTVPFLLGLDDRNTDTLEYFDPGLVPKDFTECPKDLVDPTAPAP